MRAWYFVPDTGCIPSKEPEEVVGKSRVNDKPLVLNQNGLHFSTSILHALNWCHGSILCRVSVTGNIIIGKDHGCASERIPLWIGDVSDTLHEFAMNLASRIIRDPDDIMLSRSIDRKRMWLKGDIGTNDLDKGIERMERLPYQSDRKSLAIAVSRPTAWISVLDVCRIFVRRSKDDSVIKKESERLESMIFSANPEIPL